MQSLRNSLEDYINKNKLKEKKIGLACSGGVDSMVLLDLLVQLISKKNLYIYHCNHSWHNRSHDIKESTPHNNHGGSHLQNFIGPMIQKTL